MVYMSILVMLHLSSRLPAALASVTIAAGCVACGARTELSDTGAGGAENAGDGGGLVTDTGAGGAENAGDGGGLVTMCALFGTVGVGSYLVETDYWNQASCPGTQCMTVNSETGAFSVTEGPDCGDTAASFPNTLYGSSYGVSSTGSVLPLQVSTLSSVTSNWDFSVGGSTEDAYDVAYDIWFCPDTSCGASGFPGGLELMIWLDYQNTGGWEMPLGSVSLAGYTWNPWVAPPTGDGSTYLAYLIQPPMVTSVTSLDLLAFFKDAEARGYLQSSWYLYAVQAGDELRMGGLPFVSTTFSVTVN
jgi:Glycosyl hydrolase family 12